MSISQIIAAELTVIIRGHLFCRNASIGEYHCKGISLLCALAGYAAVPSSTLSNHDNSVRLMDTVAVLGGCPINGNLNGGSDLAWLWI